MLSICYPLGTPEDTRYEYDILGRLSKVSVHERNDTPLGTPEDTLYTYDALGNLDAVSLPNGVVSDYDYDLLNRLELLRHFEDIDEDGVFDTGESLLAEFDYELLLDGKRSGVTETDEDGNQTAIDWVYDELGRLVFEESYSAQLPARCYIDDYQYDLVGNRLTKDHDIGGDDIVDEAITYLYDANDRLLVETRDDLTVADDDGYTHYEYGPNADFTDPANRYGGDFTEQTKKIAYTGDEVTGTRTSQTDYTYNLRGRQESADVKQYDVDGVTITSQTTTAYTYNDSGIRTSQTVDDGTGAVTTDYVIDGNNLTGYAQVLEEHVDGQLTKTYTIGHDMISQADATGTVHHFLYDGHGSNRALLDTSGSVVESYAYDAYGNAVGFNAATALTTILYCGEQFDVATDQHYLRARYYDAAIGRLNRVDPYAGDVFVPNSLHKYLYGHADPVTYVDPSGEFVMGSFLTGITLRQAIVGVSLISSIAVGMSVYETFFVGSAPTAAESARIKLAIAELEGNIAPVYAGQLQQLTIKSAPHDDALVGGRMSWGRNGRFSLRTIILSRKLLQEVDVEFIASTILHETHHSLEYAKFEKPAYQAQSDFLRTIGIQGKIHDIRRQFPNTVDGYLMDLLEGFEEYDTENPAITR